MPRRCKPVPQASAWAAFSCQVAPFLKNRQLRTVLEAFEPPVRPISVVYPHARLLPMGTPVFIEWIRHELREFQT